MPLAQASFTNASNYGRKMWPQEFKGALVFAWLLILHVTAVIGLVICPLPGWRVFIASLTLLFLGGLGATLVYHRAIAHRSMKLNPVVHLSTNDWLVPYLLFFRQPCLRSTAFGSRASASSSISPVAMRMTLTAFPMTSAGRFSPLALLWHFQLSDLRTCRRQCGHR